MDIKLWPEKNIRPSVNALINADSGGGNNNNLLSDCDKFQDNANNNEEKCNRNFKLQQDVEAVISEKGRQKIQIILEQVDQLMPIEKLLLYLKLPTENNNVDPLRQSLNPLGSRSEINQTIMWIQTHLEEDKELSLQKKGVYDDYVTFCEFNKIKPLSTADFGKVMKQVYPNVRPRRLGTRGQSKYCYSGLRNRIKLSVPTLPDLSGKLKTPEKFCTNSDIVAAAWIIIKEWAEHKLSMQFNSINALAFYLVKEYSVGNGSDAAEAISSSNSLNKDHHLSSSGGYINRHKETTLQLQRKLHQKCEVKETKRKQQMGKVEPKQRGKKIKMSTSSTSCSPSENLKNGPQTREVSDVCDLQMSLPDFNSLQQHPNHIMDSQNRETQLPIECVSGKVAIPRITNNVKQSTVIIAQKKAKNNKYKAIQPKPDFCDRATYNPNESLVSRDPRSQQDVKTTNAKEKEEPVESSLITTEESNTLFSRERLISIGQVAKDALDEYLGTSNSQEQEEEIMQYFGNNNHDQETTSKLSQLRLLLEKNRIAQKQNSYENVPPLVKANLKRVQKSAIPPNLQNINSKRRISYDVHDETVPASPNTRRQNINFIPISPISPNGGRQSKCSSTNASPFVSPRNTPVPRSRGNSHPYLNNNNNNNIPKQGTVKFKREKQKKLELIENLKENEFFKHHHHQHQLLTLPMSAPPSPKANAYNKNIINFQIQGQNFDNSLSPEILQIPNSNNISHSFESAIRSQSVPLNPIQTTQLFKHFNFATTDQNNEFNNYIDFNSDNLNVNKIIDEIDQTNLDILNIGIGNDFESNSNIITNNIEDFSGLKLPSRSVPNTPLPYNPCNIEQYSMKSSINSKSYPNTPLTAESFTFTPGQDYLLNGQPIKFKNDTLIKSNETKTNLYQVYEGDLVVDNKRNFNYETSAMANEGNFGAKENINNILNESNVDELFKVVNEKLELNETNI